MKYNHVISTISAMPTLGEREGEGDNDAIKNQDRAFQT